jgi:putative transposase
VLTIVDTFSRMSPMIVPRLSFRGADIVDVLQAARRGTGFSMTIRVDHSGEFVSRDHILRVYQRGVILVLSLPSKPIDNALIEAFDGRLLWRPIISLRARSMHILAAWIQFLASSTSTASMRDCG